jgi:hypothetical protein
MDKADALNPWRWPATWMNAAWLRGVCDLLDWVLGDRSTSPLGQQVSSLPTASDLVHEDVEADDVVSQGRPAGTLVEPQAYPPPQYGEAIQAAIRWLQGEGVVSPVDQAAYDACPPSGCKPLSCLMTTHGNSNKRLSSPEVCPESSDLRSWEL